MDRDDRRLAAEVFARSRVAPRPGLVGRVRARVANERRRRPADGSWQLLVAGTALALALAAGVLLDAGALTWPSGHDASPAPNATALGRRAPAGPMPTFLVAAAGGTQRRVDWSGGTVGAFAPPPGTLDTVAAPDGALVALRTAGGVDVVDAAGQPVATLPAFGAWSGDGLHVACALAAAGALQVVATDLRDPTRPLSTSVPVTGGDGPAGWTLLGCGARSDLLVAVRQERDGTGRYGLAETMLVRMGTGAVLSRIAYGDGAAPAAPVLSHDARFLAENDPDRRVAAIRDLASGEVIGHVAGLVTAFSGDDRLVLTATEAGAPTATSRTALVDWRWGRTVWSEAGQATPLAARPDGDQVAFALATPGRTRILLAGRDGRALELDAPTAQAA
jgi:hypothetical protein